MKALHIPQVVKDLRNAAGQLMRWVPVAKRDDEFKRLVARLGQHANAVEKEMER